MTPPAVMLFVEIELELTSYAAIGAPESNESRTGGVQPVARNGWDDPWVPPTSLAGSFRAHLGKDLGEDAARKLMGEATNTAASGSDPDEDPSGTPSTVFFLGTELHLPEGKDIVVRGQTAIDPHRAAAKETLLRHKQYLRPGTRLLCRIRVDGEEHHDRVLDALTTWQPVIGGGRSTGHGLTKTLAIRHTTIDLNTPEGRRRWLFQGGPDLFTGAESRTPKPQQQPADITLTWKIEDALHIGSTRSPEPGTATQPAPGPEGRSSKPAPLLRNEENQPYLPGATWKGILRGRCAYLLRSLDLLDCDDTNPCGPCDLCTAFGWTGDRRSRDHDPRQTGESGEDDADDGPLPVGARSHLRFTDSPVDAADVRIRNHVAIDRVFGGAADGLLFSEEVVESGTLTLRIHHDGEVPRAVTHALHLALHDLHTGALGIGGGTTRGYGTLRCTDPAWLEDRRAEARSYFATRLREREEATTP